MAPALSGCDGPARPGPAATSTATAAAEPARLNDSADRQFAVAPLQVLRLARLAEAAAVQAGDRKEQARALKYQGRAHYLLENYAAALPLHYRALALNEQAGDRKGQADCLLNIGNVYKSLEQYPKAIELYRQTLRLRRQEGDSARVALTYANLANALSHIDTLHMENLLRYYRQALAIHREEYDSLNQAVVLNNIGQRYLDRRRYAEARPYFARCLHLGRLTKNHRQQALYLMNLGHVSHGLRQFPAALAYYRQSASVGHAFPDLVRKDLQYASQTQAQMGNYAAAYALYRRFTARKDSAFTRETTDRISELETRFQTQQQEKQLQVQQLTIRRKNQLLYAVLAAAAALLAFAAGLGHQMRQKNRANRALAGANREIRQSVAEKEVLIQEVHHRVKNNLQMVSSLLGWQARALPDPALATALAESRARIQSMALVHEHLYQSDNLAHVQLDRYLTELLASLQHSFAASQPGTTIHLRTELAPLVVEAKEAIPFGLLLNELITNAYKHAFAGRATGELRVLLTGGPGNGFRLRIEDDGVGLPPEGAVRPHSLGMQLVRMLTKQLKATLSAGSAASPATGAWFEVRRG